MYTVQGIHMIHIYMFLACIFCFFFQSDFELIISVVVEVNSIGYSMLLIVVSFLPRRLLLYPQYLNSAFFFFYAIVYLYSIRIGTTAIIRVHTHLLSRHERKNNPIFVCTHIYDDYTV